VIVAHHNSIAALFFGAVQSVIRHVDQALGVFTLFRKSCDSCRYSHRAQTLSSKLQCEMLDRLADFFDARAGAIRVGFRKHQREFFTAKTAGEVSGAHAGLKHRGNFPEEEISRLMSEGVVEMLEMIDVQHRQGNTAFGPGGAVHFSVELLFQIAAIEQSGQRILDGLVTEDLAQLEVGYRQ